MSDPFDARVRWGERQVALVEAADRIARHLYEVAREVALILDLDPAAKPEADVIGESLNFASAAAVHYVELIQARMRADAEEHEP